MPGDMPSYIGVDPMCVCMCVSVCVCLYVCKRRVICYICHTIYVNYRTSSVQSARIHFTTQSIRCALCLLCTWCICLGPADRQAGPSIPRNLLNKPYTTWYGCGGGWKTQWGSSTNCRRLEYDVGKAPAGQTLKYSI